MVNKAGNHPSYGESLMFDSDPATFWHSEHENDDELKIIGFQFIVSFYLTEIKKIIGI